MSSIIQPTLDELDLAAFMDVMAPLLGLTLAADWRLDVLSHLKAIVAAAALVQAYPLDDALEAASVFQA